MNIINLFINSIEKFIYLFLGDFNDHFYLLIDFIIAEAILMVIVNLKFKSNLPKKINTNFFQKKIAIFIIIGVSNSLDILTGVNIFHDLVVFYFIAMEATLIINMAIDIGIPIPEQLINSVKNLGNYDGENSNKKSMPM